MNIDIIITADNINPEKIKGKTVVVIDMLRATSVITTAINNGCNKVIPVTEVQDALNITRNNKSLSVLGGERKAKKIEGFHFSNSPLEYTSDKVINKDVIITTTNGTKAINKSIGANYILIGAIINAKSVAKKLIEIDDDVVLINAGTYGQFSIDDFICSGYIIDCISQFYKSQINLTDISKTALYIYRNNPDIENFIKNAAHYNTMKELGLLDDFKYCCQKDIIDIVPEYKDGQIN